MKIMPNPLQIQKGLGVPNAQNRALKKNNGSWIQILDMALTDKTKHQLGTKTLFTIVCVVVDSNSLLC